MKLYLKTIKRAITIKIENISFKLLSPLSLFIGTFNARNGVIKLHGSYSVKDMNIFFALFQEWERT